MRFTQVDVFGDGGVSGNPLAVVHEADGLTDAEMQAFASWTNLSETTFLLPPADPAADYRVRIFTGTNELPFAGHPTLGSASAWLAAGGRPRNGGEVVQECGVGLVRVRLDDDRLAFAAPARLRTGPLDEAHLAVAEATLGLPRREWVAHEWGDNGPPWMMVELADAAAVRAVRPDHTQLGANQHLGIVGRATGQYSYEVRGFVGNWEDPVTGSLNAAVAQWLRGRGDVPASYVATQGSQLGRHGEVFVHDDGTDVWIGGRVRAVIAGTVDL
jgi:PhzF family phenazine biosynthesis protein